MNNELRILRTDHVILLPRKRSRRISGFILHWRRGCLTEHFLLVIWTVLIQTMKLYVV